MKKIFIKVLLACIVLIATSLVFLNWDSVLNIGEERAGNQPSESESALEHAQLHVDPTYVCPMHSQITDTKQSSCPICGMDLELRNNPQSQSSGSETVLISAAMVNNLGVRLEHTEIGQVAEQVYASGFVEKVSDAQQADIKSKVNGKLYEIIVQPGQWVEQEDVLLRIDVTSYESIVTRYADAMETAQIQEALKLRKKLAEMGVGNEVLAAYHDDRPLSKYLEIVAPFSGEVSWVMDKVESIKVGDRLVEVTSPALAEVNLRCYSRVARGVKVGHRGSLGVTHMPGRTWPGRVTEVIHNRVGFYTTIRFHVEVTPGALEAGAFAGAYVDAGTAEKVLRVPTSAVIYDEDSTRVIRLSEDDSFEVVEVDLGFEGHKWIEIKFGLDEGDHVVTRGQFLIDSEATLQAGFKRLSSQ